MPVTGRPSDAFRGSGSGLPGLMSTPSVRNRYGHGGEDRPLVGAAVTYAAHIGLEVSEVKLPRQRRQMEREFWHSIRRDLDLWPEDFHETIDTPSLPTGLKLALSKNLIQEGNVRRIGETQRASLRVISTRTSPSTRPTFDHAGAASPTTNSPATSRTAGCVVSPARSSLYLAAPTYSATATTASMHRTAVNDSTQSSRLRPPCDSSATASSTVQRSSNGNSRKSPLTSTRPSAPTRSTYASSPGSGFAGELSHGPRSSSEPTYSVRACVRHAARS